MLKTYQKYIIKNFLSKFILITLIFLSLIIILSSLEEISFTKDANTNFILPYFLTIINAPITLFEIFPFIFLLTTQFMFYDLKKKDELDLLKINGLNNYSVIKILFFLALTIGLFNMSIFYNMASNLKFYYSEIKNKLSDDNKFLAMVTKSGLWIKDESDGNKIIIKSKSIKDYFIEDTIISEFDKNFNLIRVIQSKKIDIKENNWIIYNPIITTDNSSILNLDKINLKTNFNYEKIINFFSNVSTLDFFKLFKLKDDFEKLGYSTNEITIHILKLLTTPIIYMILAIFSSVIMIIASKNIPIFFHISLGFLISVIIYYLMFFFSSFGISGTIPIVASYSFPILLLTIISIMGLIIIHDK
jgi:lipopolysaccharide export system permease protein